jgi:2-haloacid dehalogenase
MRFPTDVRALLFDVFGTVVDWRTTVTQGLYDAAQQSLQSDATKIPIDVRNCASAMSLEDWGRFAQKWRNEYMKYCQSRAADSSLPVTTIDEHHFESLKGLLHTWSLEGLWSTEQVQQISLIWHRLVPWKDSAPGLKALASRYPTCTLSNGNFSLLEDLRSFGELSFSHLFSAEAFGTFKPNKAVYLGGADKLGLLPTQCALVAAHLGDLKAAKGCGYFAVYVERPQEENWSQDKIEEAKAEGWVDLWIKEGEDGFLAVERGLLDKAQL